MRFTDAELLTMKNAFADNDALLYTVRKLMLGFDLDGGEKKMIKSQVGEVVYKVLYKLFFPTLDPDAPIFQLTDMVMGLNADFKNTTASDIAILIQAKQLEMDYIVQQLEYLKDVDNSSFSKSVDLDDLIEIKGKDSERAQLEITARNYLLSYIDSNIQQLKFLAGKKEESVEETVERLARDSAK